VFKSSYEERLGRLQSLATAISSLRRKQEYYGFLVTLVEETLGEPTVNVQPNIVTKAGPIADELRRMRPLLARVTEHLSNAQLNLKPPDESVEDEMPESWTELSLAINQSERDEMHD
jgi:hypothetical protein